MGWFHEKWLMFVTIIRMIDVEPFIILYVATGTIDVARTQLVQDKLCYNKYNQTRAYCIELSKSSAHRDEDNPDEIAHKILGEVSQYLTYITMLSSLPGIFYVLFIAPWIDRYIHGRKIVMCLSALGGAAQFVLLILNSYYFDWDVGYVLITCLPSTLVGGWSAAFMTVYSYMANNSTKANRYLKFTAFEMSSYLCRPVAQYFSGYLLGKGNYQSDGNMHYYERSFYFYLFLCVAALVYVLVVINENKTQKKRLKRISENKNGNKSKADKEISDNFKHMSYKFEFSKIIDITNFKDMFQTAVKKRPNGGRLKIWLLYLSMCLIILADAKFFSILFVYTERVYEWDATMFSNVKSLAMLVQPITMPFASGILSGYMKLSDSKLGIIGFIITALQDISIGSIIHPLGLYLLFIIGSITGLASLAVRSLLTKIAPESESGKIFALMGAIELVFKAIEDLFLNSVFRFSIDFFPSLLFEIAAILNFIPLFIFYWLDINHKPIYTKN